MRFGQRTTQWIFLLLLCLTQASAETTSTKEAFDPKDANLKLDKLTVQLSVALPTSERISGAINVFNELKDQATECVKLGENELLDITEMLKQYNATSTSAQDLTADQRYLQSKKLILEQRIGNCRLFLLRVDEALVIFGASASKLATTHLFEREPHFWDHIQDSGHFFRHFKENYDPATFWKKMGVLEIQRWHVVVLFLLLGLALSLGLTIARKLKEYVQSQSSENLSQSLTHTFVAVTRKYEMPLLLVSAIALFSGIFYVVEGLFEIPLWLSLSLLAFLTYLILIRVLISPPSPCKPIIEMQPKIKHSLMFRMVVFGLLCLVASTIYILMTGQNFPPLVTQLPSSILITVIAVSLVSIVWLFNKSPLMVLHHRVLRFFLSLIVGISLVVILVADWTGYHHFATYLIIGEAATFITCTIAFVLHTILKNTIHSLQTSQHPTLVKTRQWLGLKLAHSIPEVWWLQLSGQLLIWGGLVLALIRIWFLSPTYYQDTMEALMQGIEVAGFHIYPIRIVVSMAIFVLLALFTRLIRQRIAQNKELPHANRGARIALSSIVGYVGFIVSAVFALLIAGVNFSGLAIIAGALSVGVGFGLQTIVNNFVSGLILLIERPIRQGDRIIVGGVEGHVKSISIRYTRILTVEKSDIIVPNAELISTQVTNLMFNDMVGRIENIIGVAYDSDVNQVREILVRVAKEHENVINDRVDVLFKNFGDSALEFKLRSVVNNIDKKREIHSELNFAIFNAMKEANIEIPFPQRDLHIKDAPPGLLSKGGELAI